MRRTKARVLAWNEVEQEREVCARQIEEQVELRLHTKRLADCELPVGFKLVTPTPKQFWLEQQMRWGFCLEYTDLKHLHSYQFIARYIQQVPDEAQMRWALEEFSGELLAAGYALGEIKAYLPSPQSTPLRNIPSSPSHLRVA